MPPCLSNAMRSMAGRSVNGAWASLPKKVLCHLPRRSLKYILCPPLGMAMYRKSALDANPNLIGAGMKSYSYAFPEKQV